MSVQVEKLDTLTVILRLYHTPEKNTRFFKISFHFTQFISYSSQCT